MPVVHPENQAAETGEAISNHAHKTLHHLSYSDLGRAQNAGPTESAPLRTTQVPEPERLRPGRCMQPRASLRRFPAGLSSVGREGTCAVSGGRPSVAATPERTPVLFVYTVPPSSQHD